jgi:hypothetical protein
VLSGCVRQNISLPDACPYVIAHGTLHKNIVKGYLNAGYMTARSQYASRLNALHEATGRLDVLDARIWISCDVRTGRPSGVAEKAEMKGGIVSLKVPLNWVRRWRGIHSKVDPLVPHTSSPSTSADHVVRQESTRDRREVAVGRCRE